MLPSDRGPPLAHLPFRPPPVTLRSASDALSFLTLNAPYNLFEAYGRSVDLLTDYAWHDTEAVANCERI